MKHFYCFFVFALVCFSLSAQDKVNGDSLAVDFRYLVKQLEATHPDPYTGFGGKVFFCKQAFDLENELRQSPHTLQQFWDKSMAFLSFIQDGHTYLFSLAPKQQKEQSLLPVGFRCIPDGLVVQTLSVSYKDLLGSALVGVNGRSLDELLTRTASIFACENLYNRYSVFCRNVARKQFMQQLLPDLKEDVVSFNLRTPEGKEMTLEVAFMESEEQEKAEKASLPSWDGCPTGQMDYRFIDKQQQVMMFKVNSIMARDNFEYMYKYMKGDLYRQMEFYYQQKQGKEMPADTLQAIRELPSFSGTFAAMLKEMKKNHSEYLIIDLRDNSGGWTPIVLATLYQLYGDRYLQTDMDTEYYRIVSPLYMNKLETTLEDFNQRRGTHYAFGDYTFSAEEADDAAPLDTLRRQFIEECMSSVKEELRAQQGAAVYTPKRVFVVTNERTFSAAFHYAFMLWKMGATVVGVPSGQAPNTFMEQTLFKLPYTGVEGSISNSMQVFLPGKDKRAKTFWPDLMPTHEEYAKYGFDKQAEILFLLDRIGREE